MGNSCLTLYERVCRYNSIDWFSLISAVAKYCEIKRIIFDSLLVWQFQSIRVLLEEESLRKIQVRSPPAKIILSKDSYTIRSVWNYTKFVWVERLLVLFACDWHMQAKPMTSQQLNNKTMRIVMVINTIKQKTKKKTFSSIRIQPN